MIIKSRDEAYKIILHHGLIQIRMWGFKGMNKLCAVEADHLHNIPTYIGSDNKELHEFYLNTEVKCYLKDMANHKEDSSPITVWHYEKAWEYLQSFDSIFS